MDRAARLTSTPQPSHASDPTAYTIAAAIGQPLPAPVGAITWVVNISHEFGIDTAVFATQNAAVRWVAEYAREWWGDTNWGDTNDGDDEDTVNPPADDNEAIDQYFSAVADTYQIEQKTIRDA